MIGFYTGLRISEAFALTWDDIDFEKRTLSVNKQVVKRNFGADVRKVVEKKGKKEGKKRQKKKVKTTVSKWNEGCEFGMAIYIWIPYQ